MVVHEAGTRDDRRAWARLLEAELQPLDPSVPRGVVLAGAPSRNLAAAVRPDGARQLLRQLSSHYQFVVVDAGSDLDPASPTSAQCVVLEVADRLFVVARADVVGLRRAATLLECLRGIVKSPDRRLALVLNRHQARHHHDAVEVARALRATVAAVIPDDPDRTNAALAAQRPLVAFGGTPRRSAARALGQLASSIEAATPADAVGTGDSRARPAWRRRLGLFNPRGRRP
jgi:Flp pilus assembly CpaE family ATPase